VVTLGFIEVGTHLVVDGICGMRETAGDVELVRSFLEYFPERMGMTRVLGPYVFSHYCGDISGIVIIAESHVSIHTFPESGYLCVDIFSCKPFDVNEALQIVNQWFPMDECHHRVFDRGIEYPKSPQALLQVLEKEKTGIHSFRSW